jgi:hypothetical protein
MKTKDGETIQDIARIVSEDEEGEEGEDASDVDSPDVENGEADTASEE